MEHNWVLPFIIQHLDPSGRTETKNSVLARVDHDAAPVSLLRMGLGVLFCSGLSFLFGAA